MINPESTSIHPRRVGGDNDGKGALGVDYGTVTIAIVKRARVAGVTSSRWPISALGDYLKIDIAESRNDAKPTTHSVTVNPPRFAIDGFQPDCHLLTKDDSSNLYYTTTTTTKDDRTLSGN